MNALFRIIDANINRSSEGLRVCEDLIRFVTNDQLLTARLKRCRHCLVRLFLSSSMHRKALIAARDSRRDVGKKSLIKNHKGKQWENLLFSNFKRAEESVRVLEECSKIVAPKLTKQIQAIRFRIYELEKQAASRF